MMTNFNCFKSDSCTRSRHGIGITQTLPRPCKSSLLFNGPFIAEERQAMYYQDLQRKRCLVARAPKTCLLCLSLACSLKRGRPHLQVFQENLWRLRGPQNKYHSLQHILKQCNYRIGGQRHILGWENSQIHLYIHGYLNSKCFLSAHFW